ncbi:MAG TPA: LPS export ABC transporter periplasmic protein LptC [Cyclobacteriaceae bacterium]|nr:LPS export ABC transporter periplasmic protein LptC [Cyclobacteriaceae bacterium]
MFRSLFIIFLILTGSCSEIIKKTEPSIYNGPLLELNNVETLYSDSSVVRLKLNAKKQLEFDNNDREFPEGIHFEIYDTDGSLSSIISSDYCYYYHETDLWRALRNVVVRNVKSGDQLNTEELFWEQKKELVYTSKFVRIETEDEILMGEGLRAKQDFSWWTILNGKGTIVLDEENQ